MKISLGIGLILSYFELQAILVIPQNWQKLLSITGIFTIVLYVILFLAGLFSLFLDQASEPKHNTFTPTLAQPTLIQWLVIGVSLIVTSWIYLFSPWQEILASPWSQLLFAAGLAKLILLYTSRGHRRSLGWGELALILTIFLFPRIIREVRVLTAVPAIYRGATVVGLMVTFGLIFLLYHPIGRRLRNNLIRRRERIGKQRIFLLPVLWLIPLAYRYLVGSETYILYPNIRFGVLLVALWAAVLLSASESGWLVSRDAFGLNLGVLILVSAIAYDLLLVINYPFSLSWSEGNRFYDYSLVFGQSLYNHEGYIVNPYSSPGRYGLWGVLFLWQGLPIWVHRFWNLILQTVPVLIFSILITRKLQPRVLRYGVMLWIALFLIVLAPLHPPFIVVSIIVAAFAFSESPVLRGISLAIASFYANTSRLTWVFVPAALGGLTDLLLYYPKRSGTLVRRLVPTFVLVLVGLLPGLIPTLQGYLDLAQGDALTASQPLLWYRLLPNNTLGPGVLFLALRYTLPLLIILAWWMISRRWRLDWIQKLAIWGALIGFFAIGLVISTKIGGGGDLHNLDMYLITLLVIMVFGFMGFETYSSPWPIWAVGVVFYSIFWVVYPFTPLFPGSNYHPFLELPKATQVNEVLSTTQNEVAKFAKSGEVLFMDQRQLLAFGYISPIPFIPDYEKKYMMDQAMGSNASYFRSYYQDLAKKRFALIVTEPLRTRRREDLGGPFSEENDAWVIWVSNPTLCFYEPIYVSTAVNVELLVPKQNPVGCEEYLKQ